MSHLPGATAQGHSGATGSGLLTKPLARGGNASLPSQSSAHLRCAPWEASSFPTINKKRGLGFCLLPMRVMAGGSIWVLGALLEICLMVSWFLYRIWGTTYCPEVRALADPDIIRKIPLNILLYSILASKQDLRNVNILFQFDILLTHSHPLSINY